MLLVTECNFYLYVNVWKELRFASMDGWQCFVGDGRFMVAKKPYNATTNYFDGNPIKLIICTFQSLRFTDAKYF